MPEQPPTPPDPTAGQAPSADPANPAPPAASESPAPAQVAGDPAAPNTPADPANPAGQTADGQTPPGPPTDPANPTPALPPADPLADGTTPTVLTPGTQAKPVTPKFGKATLGSIYRKADIATTLLTFGGAVVTAGLIVGGYLYFTTSRNPLSLPKPAKLEQADLDKITAFFQGNNAGTPAEVLTITSPTFFKERAAFASDLKVIGGVQVTGPTALTDLIVDKTATFNAVNLKGALAVSGAATIGGSLTTGGNGSFGGTLSSTTISTRDLTVSGTLNLSGHLAISGQSPTVAPGSQSGSGATASVEGNDSGGTIQLNTGSLNPNTMPNGGLLAELTFRAAYPKVPHVVITAVGANTGALSLYVIKTATGFTVGSTKAPQANTSYAFDYWISQ